MKEPSPGKASSSIWSEHGICLAGGGGRTTPNGLPTPSPTLHVPQPDRSACMLQHACGSSQAAVPRPLEAIPLARRCYASWEILLQILGRAAGPPWASGYFNGRSITGRHAGRCHIPKQTLLLSSQAHPGEILSAHGCSCEVLGSLLSQPC